jgi:hypothetical protein
MNYDILFDDYNYLVLKIVAVDSAMKQMYYNQLQIVLMMLVVYQDFQFDNHLNANLSINKIMFK